jgi:hypothetical protein
MPNREKKQNGGSFYLNPGLLTQELKTPERLWMAVLLLNQYETTPTIEEFSKISDLSFGFISKFANILRQAGFLAEGQRLKLQNPRSLLDIIRAAYFFETNEVTPYYSDKAPDQLTKKMTTLKKPYALTRMCGAALIAPFVRYQYFDFYIPGEDDLPYWKETLELVDVEAVGNVNIIVPQNSRILNQTQVVKGCQIVNNIQLYLDLYKYPARGREQAEHLREQVIKI